MAQKTIAQQLNVKEFPFQIRDKNGNVIYCEDSDGYWYKSKYGSAGNLIYHERSDGYWSKREYDSNVKCIYHEESNGYWRKCEYDSNGKCIYYESSYGTIVDSRPNPSCEGKVVEIDGKKYKLTEI